MNLQQIRRGDIYCANLAPVLGSEQGGKRPVLVIQNNIGNRHSPTIITAVITGQIKSRYLPTHVLLESALSSLSKDSMVMLEQLRTLDRCRLREYLGHVPAERMAEINTALQISIGLAGLSGRNTLHHAHTPQWNKHMVKRILENPRYLGTDGFPQLISDEDYRAVER